MESKLERGTCFSPSSTLLAGGFKEGQYATKHETRLRSLKFFLEGRTDLGSADGHFGQV